MRPISVLVISTLAAIVFASCIGGPGNAGVAWLRNESSQPVGVSIDHASHSFLGGTEHLVLGVPPWQEGWCYALGYGINAGSVTISVSGPSVPFPTSTTITVPTTPQTDVTALIDSTGAVHFTNGAPQPDKAACEGYQQVVPTDSPQRPAPTPIKAKASSAATK
jgi:hypothetical protein